MNVIEVDVDTLDSDVNMARQKKTTVGKKALMQRLKASGT